MLVAGRTATKIEQVVRTVGSAGGIAEAVLTDATVCWASRRSLLADPSPTALGLDPRGGSAAL